MKEILKSIKVGQREKNRSQGQNGVYTWQAIQSLQKVWFPGKEVELAWARLHAQSWRWRVPRVGLGTHTDIRRGLDSAGKERIPGGRWRESWAGGNVQISVTKRRPLKGPRRHLLRSVLK